MGQSGAADVVAGPVTVAMHAGEGTLRPVNSIDGRPKVMQRRGMPGPSRVMQGGGRAYLLVY